jgi:hypothetical protein
MIMHLLAYVICTAEIIYVSLALLRFLGVEGIAKRILAVGLLNCAQMILAVEALSLIHSISLRNLLLLHSSICTILLIGRIKPGDLFSGTSLITVFRESYRSCDKYLKVMLVITILGGLTTFMLAVLVPPNNNDSMAYHLVRVGVYMQQGSLEAFPTADLRQTSWPANAEILALWQMVLLLNDRTVGLVQWLAWCGCILAVFIIARHLNFSFRAALFAALAFGSFPEIVLQSTSTQNDLIAVFFLLCSFVFFVEVPGGRLRFSELVLPALGLGLAIGTKPITALMFPGLGIYAFTIWKKMKWLTLPRIAVLIAIILICAFLWGSYFYIQNTQIYGTPSGPPVLRLMTMQENLEWSVAWSNFGRLLLQFLNPSDNIPPGFGIREFIFRGYGEFAEQAFKYLHISKQLPAKDFPGGPWEEIFRAPWLQEDYSSYGIVFGYLLLPIVFLTLVVPSFLRLGAHTWSLAFASLCYWVLVSCFFRWNIWTGRFMMPMVGVAAPLLACLWLQQNGVFGRIWKVVLVGLCGVSIALSSLTNASKPVFGSWNIFGKDRMELMTGTAYLHGFRFIDSLDIKGLKLGVLSSVSYRIYPFFGPHFERVVIPIRLDREELLDTRKLPDVDCLLVFSNTQVYFPAGKAGSSVGPFYASMNLDPLLRQINDPKSEWQAVYHIKDFGDLYAKGRHLQAIKDKVASISAARQAASVMNSTPDTATSPAGIIPIPGDPLISPSGNIQTANPTYTWKAIPNASWYQLVVNDSQTESSKIRAWLTATQAGCSTGKGICVSNPNVSLSSGPARWSVQAWNNTGNGPLIGPFAFTVVDADPPSKATLVSPKGDVRQSTATYCWIAVPDATWYQLWVNDSSQSPRILRWYTPEQAGCSLGKPSCAITPGVTLTPGAAEWWVLTLNSHGQGPSSGVMNFRVVSPQQGKGLVH